MDNKFGQLKNTFQDVTLFKSEQLSFVKVLSIQKYISGRHVAIEFCVIFYVKSQFVTVTGGVI